jgi:hypothetical protein
LIVDEEGGKEVTSCADHESDTLTTRLWCSSVAPVKCFELFMQNIFYLAERLNASFVENAASNPRFYSLDTILDSHNNPVVYSKQAKFMLRRLER